MHEEGKISHAAIGEIQVGRIRLDGKGLGRDGIYQVGMHDVAARQILAKPVITGAREAGVIFHIKGAKLHQSDQLIYVRIRKAGGREVERGERGKLTQSGIIAHAVAGKVQLLQGGERAEGNRG